MIRIGLGCYIAWCATILWMVGDALRDNDQAAYLDGAWQLAGHGPAPSPDSLYNYDKQFGSFWLLAAIVRLAHFETVIFWSNLIQALAFCCAVGALLVSMWRQQRSLLYLIPFALSPVLVISAPFFGTSLLSLTFVLAGLAIFRRGQLRRQIVGGLLMLIAACCRADVLLAMPMFLLAQHGGASARQWLRRPFLWIIVAASVVPLVVGRLLVHVPSTDAAFVPFQPTVFMLFILFGVGIVPAALLAWNSVFFCMVARRKRRSAAHYMARGLAPLIPFVFYSLQLHTPRYYLLTLACYMFAMFDPRTWLMFGPHGSRVRSLVDAMVVTITLLPWFIGIRMPDLHSPSVTFGAAQTFPTAKGHFPMGSYLDYVVSVRKNGFLLDHNENIFLAAMSVPYRACDGHVAILSTPMEEYLQLAVRLHGLVPQLVEQTRDTACEPVYADARSLIRGLSRHPTDRQELTNASLIAGHGGQAIVGIGRSTTDFGALLDRLRTQFAGREFEFSMASGSSLIDIGPLGANGGVLFGLSASDCRLSPTGEVPADYWPVSAARIQLWPIRRGQSPRKVAVTCQGPSATGWAAQVLPTYMSR